MMRSRITTGLLIAEIVITGLLFAGTISRAISLSDIGITRPQSLDVQIITSEQGLNGTKYSQCTGDIFTLFNGQLQQQAKQWAVDTANMLLNSLKTQLATRAVCSAGNWLSKQTVFGYRLAGFFSQCDTEESSTVKEQLVLELKNRLKSNFLVNCTSTMMRYHITDTVTGMIQTQGYDGGMAAATDFLDFLSRRPARMAQRQWWTTLVNTNICPWFREEALNNLGVPKDYRDNPPPLSATGYSTDERPPFSLRAGCTLDYTFDVTDPSPEAVLKNSGWQLLSEMEKPQNNLRDFEKMALSEFAILKEERLKIANTEFLAGGGFTSTRGECAKGPNGECVDDGVAKQVPGAVRDINQVDMATYFNALNAATGEQGLMDDIAARIQARILDLANKPLPFKLELGPERDPKYFTPEPTPTLSPGETGPDDVACTGGNPLCTCVKDVQTARDIASQAIAPVTGMVMEENPSYFVNGSSQIAPGVDYRLILQAICNKIGSIVCHPHPNQDDEIVIVFGQISTSYDVITGDGYIRTDGGSPVAACSEGVQ